ncbi:unnamed protein product, partial [Pleuronectes platessa]
MAGNICLSALQLMKRDESSLHPIPFPLPSAQASPPPSHSLIAWILRPQSVEVNDGSEKQHYTTCTYIPRQLVGSGKDGKRDEVVLGDKDMLSDSWGIGAQQSWNTTALGGGCLDEELLEVDARLVFLGEGLSGCCLGCP